MLKSLKMAGLAAAVTLGALASVSAPAAAQNSREIIIGPDGARVRARDFCQRNPSYDGCRDFRRGGDRGDRVIRDGYGSGRGGYDDGPRRDNFGEDRGRFGGDDGFRRDSSRRFVRMCGPDEALNKARRMGIRRAQIVGVGERSIRVAGRADGRTVMVRFGRRGNCPVL